jgi:hypothetical protein
VRQGDLAPKTQRVFLLRGIRDECIEILNLMSGGDISQLEYDTIIDLCCRHSKGTSKTSRGPRDILARTDKTTRGGVTREKIRNMIENFKIDLLSNLRFQLDTLQTRKKKEEIEQDLAIVLPKCRTKNPWKECLLD